MDLRIRDEASLFSTANIERLQASVQPFDLHVVTGTSYHSKSELTDRVHNDVDGPNVVAIGIDPQHHWVIVHFGKGLGVSSSSWSSIASSGNADFKTGDWAGGVLEIAKSTQQARTQTSVVVPVEHRVSDPSHGTEWLIAFSVVIGIAALLGLIVWWIDRQKSARLSASFAGCQSYAPTVPRVPTAPASVVPVASSPYVAPSTVVVNGNNSDGLLTGYLIGSSMNQQSHVVEREVVRETYTPTPSSSYDSGGSSSTYESSNDSSSSWDSGGSSGFDSGGGGFDSGGGGSDF